MRLYNEPGEGRGRATGCPGDNGCLTTCSKTRWHRWQSGRAGACGPGARSALMGGVIPVLSVWALTRVTGTAGAGATGLLTQHRCGLIAEWPQGGQGATHPRGAPSEAEPGPGETGGAVLRCRTECPRSPGALHDSCGDAETGRWQGAQGPLWEGRRPHPCGQCRGTGTRPAPGFCGACDGPCSRALLRSSWTRGQGQWAGR